MLVMIVWLFVYLLVMALIFSLLLWAARMVMAAFAVPPQFQTVITAILALIFVLIFIALLFGGIPAPGLHPLGSRVIGMLA